MVVLQGWGFVLGFMPSNHYPGSDTSRPEMGIMGIMNRARGMQIVENGFQVRIMFLGLLLSIVNLPRASGVSFTFPPPDNSAQNPQSPAPAPSASQDHPPPLLPPVLSPLPPPLSSSTPGVTSPPPSVTPPSASPVVFSPASGGSTFPPALVSPPPPSATTTQSPTIVNTGGDTWNESEKAGVVIASIAALLQVAVVAFLLIKRHQMLTTVEYDDIEDLEYDTPPDSNFRDIESA